MNNFTDILIQQANERPNAIALIKENEQISYHQLNKLVWQCATYLYQQGIREGDVVVHMFEDELLIVIAMLANARMGATMLASVQMVSKEFLEEVVNEINASFILSDSNINQLTSEETIPLRIDFFKEIEINKTCYIKKPIAPWQIVIGSGSTGKRKLIVIPHTQEVARQNLLKNWLGYDFNDRVTSFTPLSYPPSKRRFLESITAGSTYMILSNSKQFIPIQTLQEYQVTVLHTNVFHIQNILNSLPKNSCNILSFLKILSIGSSIVNDELRKNIYNKLTKKLYIRYGTNESGPIALTSTCDIFNTQGTVGRIIKEVKVEIVDDKGNIKSANKEGLIRVKSPFMINSYYNDAKATEKAFKGGWFYTGDLGKFNDDGQLIHLGRADDMMILSGINIYNFQIENEMLKHPDVEEAFAFPFKHEVYQEIPVCAVVLKKDSNATQKTLLNYVRKNLGIYGPRLIKVLVETPRNQQGKIVRKDLIQLI